MLCYTCTGKYHGVAKCRSRSCGRCGEKRYTSLCTKKEMKSRHLMGSIKETIHPNLVVEANGQIFRVMLETGAGILFAFTMFICHMGIKPSYWEAKSIETMTTTLHQNFPAYDVNLWSTDGINCLDVK